MFFFVCFGLRMSCVLNSFDMFQLWLVELESLEYLGFNLSGFFYTSFPFARLLNMDVMLTQLLFPSLVKTLAPAACVPIPFLTSQFELQYKKVGLSRRLSPGLLKPANDNDTRETRSN